MIDFDFDSLRGDSSTQTGAAVLGTSGDIWNGVNPALGGLAGAVDSTGTATSVSIATPSAFDYGNANGSPIDSVTAPLMEDYIYGASYQSNSYAPSLGFSGLSAYLGQTFRLSTPPAIPPVRVPA